MFDSAPYHDALSQCLTHWDLIPESTELIRDGVNHVFGANSRRGERVIIRIGDGSSRLRSEVEAELLWLDHLIRNGCTVTTPVRSRRGELLETVQLDSGEFHVCCFQRFEGCQINAATDPQWNDGLLEELGRSVGRIHRVSDDFQLPTDRDRRPWYECNLCQVPDPIPAGFHPRLAEKMRDFIAEFRDLETKPRWYGLIHRDVHAGNFLVEHGKIQLIDFDLACYGWRITDFAVLLFSQYLLPSNRVPSANPETAGRALASMVRGYRTEYEVEREQFELLDSVLKLREIIFYVVAVPAIEHWQIAMGNPHPTVAESLKWVERRWLGGEKAAIDLKFL